MQELEIGGIITGLLGGLALFLFGMELMTGSLKNVAGGGMKRILEQLTSNKFTGVLAGAFVTSIIQSSSVTTVLTVGFVSAGLISVQQTVGIIMGAQIGTTITAQIVAFKVTEYSLLLISFGFLLKITANEERLRQYGTTILGLGLIFFGMGLMDSSTYPLRKYQPFIDLMLQMDTPIWGILAGALFTAIIQSSSASIALVIVLAGQGLITLEGGIAVTLGANIGTCVTALLSTIGRPKVALQTALIHVFFNVFGVLIWVWFIGELSALVKWISPVVTELNGLEKITAEAPRQIANAHTIFNVANTLFFIWFADYFAKLAKSIAPDKPEKKPDKVKPEFLDTVMLENPELALDRVRLELGNVGKKTLVMMQQALPAVTTGSSEDLLKLAKLDDDVDILHTEIINYLALLSKIELEAKQSERLSSYISIANNFENIGDLIETNIVHTGLSRFEDGVKMSKATLNVLEELNKVLINCLNKTLKAILENDIKSAQKVLDAKDEVSELVKKAEQHLVNRLTSTDTGRVTLYRLESQIIEYEKRVYNFCKRIAKQIKTLS
ncbi:MAG: Na/Pi cotransporter family protein [Nitrospinae bacterium]|nr:Na/Pi cotransporter family protein [Nitrospinota bacterium]